MSHDATVWRLVNHRNTSARVATAAVLLLASGACGMDPVDESDDRLGRTGSALALTAMDSARLALVPVAGHGNGDGLIASRARTTGQHGLRFDDQGNLFISDQNAFRVRRVDHVTGIITTVAGTGTFGFSGDGGPATAAQLSNCQDIAVGADGSLYVTDVFNQRVRRVAPSPAPPLGDGDIDGDADEIITTISGNGELDDTGEPIWAGDGGPALEASHQYPFLVGMDPGGRYLFVSDDVAVRRIDVEAGTITTVLGLAADPGCAPIAGHATQQAVLWPVGIAVDAFGNVLVGTLGGHTVMKINAGANGVVDGIAFDPDSGLLCPVDEAETVERVVGTGVLCSLPWLPLAQRPLSGPAGQIRLCGPQGLELDPDGNLYLAESGVSTLVPTVRGAGGRYIRFIEAGDGEIDATDPLTTLAGTNVQDVAGDGGPALAASFVQPDIVRLDADGNIYVSDHGAGRVRRIDGLTGLISTLIGAGANGPAMGISLSGPDGIGVDADDNLFIADTGFNRVRWIDAGVDGRVWGNDTALIVAGNSARLFNGDLIQATQAALNVPHGPLVQYEGSLYFAELAGHRLRRVAADGTITTAAGTGIAGFLGEQLMAATSARLRSPTAVLIDEDGQFFFADGANNRIRYINGAGLIFTIAGSGTAGYQDGPALQAQFRTPHGGLIGLGDDGSLYISDTGNHRVRRLESGVVSTFAGNGTIGYNGDGIPATQAALNSPQGLAFERDADGEIQALLIADAGNRRIRRVDLDTGLISTIAGTGTAGQSGVGGSPTAAQLTLPVQIAVDSAGLLYIADASDHRVYKVVLAADIDLDPDRLNPVSRGNWVTARIEIPGGDPTLVEVPSVSLEALDDAGDPIVERRIGPAPAPTSIADDDGDGLPELSVRFDRATLASWLTGGSVDVRISGRLAGGLEFSGDVTLARAH